MEEIHGDDHGTPAGDGEEKKPGDGEDKGTRPPKKFSKDAWTRKHKESFWSRRR